MLYLGKTTSENPQKYPGSGTHWTRHNKKHGGTIETVWLSEKFIDQDLFSELALFLSEFYDVVASNKWANKIVENGLDGRPKGTKPPPFTQESKDKVSAAVKARWEDEAYRSRLTESQQASWTEERRSEQGIRLKGVKRPGHSAIMKAKGFTLADDHYFRGSRTDEHKRAISDALKGKTKSDEHKQNLRKPKSEEARASYRVAQAGKAWVTNGQENRRIPAEEVFDYEAQGWRRGRVSRRT